MPAAPVMTASLSLTLITPPFRPQQNSLGGRAFAPRREADGAAGRGELDGVGDEVEERLLEAPLVGGQGAEIVRAVELKVDVLLAGALAGQGEDARHQAVDVDVLGLEHHVAGL